MPIWPPQVFIDDPPDDWRAGNEVTFHAAWVGGIGPFTVVWDFGGGAVPNAASAQTAGTAATSAVVLSTSEGGAFSVSVTVTDAQLLSGSDSTSYSYGPAALGNEPPRLELLSGAGAGTVQVRATDPDGDGITIYATPPIGMSITSPPSAVVESGGTATFTFSGDAGINVLGFQQADDPISRTFYSDAAATERLWGDSSNDYPGVPNSVTVE